MTIPKIIHQVWLDTRRPPPEEIMETWETLHPEYEYILWTMEDLIDQNFQLLPKLETIETDEGKAAMIAWEILYKMGGIYVDAHCFCVQSITPLVNNGEPFVSYDHEKLRDIDWASEYPHITKYPLLSTNVMAFPKEHPLPHTAMVRIMDTEVSEKATTYPYWVTVGAGLLTQLCNTKFVDDIKIHPSHYFNPLHSTGTEYLGHGLVYAYKPTDTTERTLPAQYTEPLSGVSIVVINRNTNASFIKECLDSIERQAGYLKLQLVWIDNGTHDVLAELTSKMLDRFESSTRFTSVSYHRFDSPVNMGEANYKAIELCEHDTLIKQEAADIMTDTRIILQFSFLYDKPEYVLCCDQMITFEKSIEEEGVRSDCNTTTKTIHVPAMAIRKSAIIDVGNYDPSIHGYVECEADVMQKLMQKNARMNIGPDTVVYHRYTKPTGSN